jgi:hypothetical protein
MKCLKGLQTWKDSLNKRPRLRSMDMCVKSVSGIKEQTQTTVIWEQGAEENSWAEEK